MGSSKYFALWRRRNGHFAIAYILFYLSRHQTDTPSCRCLCHDIQRSVRLLVGSHSVALPSRDLASQHPLQGRQLVDSNQLGFQLVGWRDDAHPAGMDQVEIISRTRLFLCRQFRCW